MTEKGTKDLKTFLKGRHANGQQIHDKYPTSSIIREMQVKENDMEPDIITMDSTKRTKTVAFARAWSTEDPVCCWREHELIQPLWKADGSF